MLGCGKMNCGSYENGSIITMICPRCGKKAYSEGIDNEIGYIYPPFHCDYGWSEMCNLQNTEGCKKCTEYEHCYNGR